MRSLIVIEMPPFLNDQFCFLLAVKPFPVQARVAQLAVEAFNEAVLPEAAWLDVGRPDILIAQPLPPTASSIWRFQTQGPSIGALRERSCLVLVTPADLQAQAPRLSPPSSDQLSSSMSHHVFPGQLF